MTLTGRIRFYLVIATLLPPLVMLSVVYYYASQQQQLQFRSDAYEDLLRTVAFNHTVDTDLTSSADRALTSDWYREASARVRRGRSVVDLDFDARWYGLDFIEILDTTNTILASWHRPSLVGTRLDLPPPPSETDGFIERLERDVQGTHPARAVLREQNGIRLYCGTYLDSDYLITLGLVQRGSTDIRFADDTTATPVAQLREFETGQLYAYDDQYVVLVAGNEAAGYYIFSTLTPDDTSGIFTPYLDIILIVMIISIALAVAVGMYITGRAKREINNLVEAFSRVADGESGVTVMAFEEGEFSLLADSFSEMTRRLTESQRKLATTEKIAAWEAIGRKIAHEVKNPLTPIAICADDIRRTHQERLPGLGDTIEKNTRMIAEEIARLRQLLDEFVSFARMRPPDLATVTVSHLLERLEDVYTEPAANDQLSVKASNNNTEVTVDPDQIHQVLVNLVKNGLEASSAPHVSVRVTKQTEGIVITVSDNGPGFTDAALRDAFVPYVTSKPNGSGLGLVICQRIIHDHGGTITVENAQRGGAVVTIVLPGHHG